MQQQPLILKTINIIWPYKVKELIKCTSDIQMSNSNHWIYQTFNIKNISVISREVGIAIIILETKLFFRPYTLAPKRADLISQTTCTYINEYN